MYSYLTLKHPKSQQTFLRKGLRLLGFFALIISIFYSSLFFAQETSSVHASQKTLIVLESGVLIFSADKSFNEQIYNNESNTDFTVISGDVINGGNPLVVVTSPYVIKRNNIKRKSNPRTDQNHKEIVNTKYQSNKLANNNQNYQIRSSSDSELFFASNNLGKNFILPNFGNAKHSNSYLIKTSFSINQCLYFYKTQKIKYSYSRTLEYFYLLIFSVRPPPFLV